MIIGFVIWSIIAVIFCGIGISCWKSQKIVGFFTFVKPPTIAVENVGKYNHAVSMLWFIAAILLEIIGVPLLFMEQNSPLVVPVILAVMALVIAMMAAFIRIENKYRE